jgi:ferredoxin-NADP reductase
MAEPATTKQSTPKPPVKKTAAKKKPKIRMYDVEVVEIAQETHDTVTLYLAKVEDDGPWEYEAGQFCTVRPHELRSLKQLIAYFEDVKGKREPARAYSLATAPHEPYVGITVKEEEYWPGDTKYPPLLSPFLVYGTPVGTRMQIQGFGGPYVYPEDIEEKADQVVHLVSGSGSVPNFGLTKDALHRGLDLRHTWIYGNKTWKDVIYREALDRMVAENPGRVEVVHRITREDDPTVHGSNVEKGRVTRELLERMVPDLDRAEFFVCGAGITKWDRLKAKETGVEPPPKFLESCLEMLAEIGVDDDRIHKESW